MILMACSFPLHIFSMSRMAVTKEGLLKRFDKAEVDHEAGALGEVKIPGFLC